MLRLLITRLNDKEYIEWDIPRKKWYTWDYSFVPLDKEDPNEILECESKEEINKIIFLISLGLSKDEIISILREDNESNILP